uniref:EF-hand domain-containing protein n=1 Tax=Meloidogyne incognita TaxID=6306 RepID=A0A914NGH5_MELIC
MSSTKTKREGKDSHTEQEMNEIQEVFQFYDTKGDGRVKVDQLGHCLRSLGLCPTEAQIAKLTENASERISFLPMLHSIRKEGAADRDETELSAFLENLDRDSSGSVFQSDLRRMLTVFGEPLSESEYEQITAGREKEEGKINISELVQTLLSFK